MAAAETAPFTGSTLTPGAVLGGRYRIVSRLGRGGMGEVWLAYDLKLKVEVALKSLRTDRFPDERGLELLRKEVRSARSVLSPNVCRIFDLVEAEGQEFVSMEYVDGQTLTDVLQARGPLELDEARSVASQLLAGLSAIHDAGLVHRDIKPENLMITRTGRAVIMDFGVAKGVTETRSGTVSGTPAYMAPEVLRGETPDGRADLFAAGVLLVETVAPDGIRKRSAREALWQGLRQVPPRMPDGPWSGVLARALAVDRELRYRTAEAFARALEEVTLRVDGGEDAHPYPGLASFTDADAKFFFGREAEVEAVWKKLQNAHLLSIIGPSGAGKSSFLQAGLVPAMPEGWRHVICHPGTKPFASLAQALAPELISDTQAIRALLRLDEPENALAVLHRWREQHDEALLILDQFEELFTLNPPEVQESFVDLLGLLTMEADVRVLLSMRDDFLLHCNAHPKLAPIFADLTPLGPPSGAALRRALVQPALACGYRFEDEALVDSMIEQLGEQRGSLPTLAFAVASLWERRDRERGMLTRSAYDSIGGVGGALARHAEATVERIGTRRLPIVREMFRNLVTAQGTRAERSRRELLSVFDKHETGEEGAGGAPTIDDAGREAAEEVLRHLTDARLVTTFDVTQLEEASDANEQRVEIVHEVLITAWPRLVRWRTQDADSAQIRDQVRQAAQVWEERGRADDFLWTGSAFREFQIWHEHYAGGLSSMEKAFSDAMYRKAEHQRKRRQRGLVAAFTVLLAVATVVSVLAFRQYEARRRAQASELLALARLVPPENTSECVAYAIASLELNDDPIVHRFAMEALWRGPTARVLPLRGILSVDFDPGGQRLLLCTMRSQLVGWLADGSRGPAFVDTTLEKGQLAWGYSSFTHDPDVFIGPRRPADGKIRLRRWPGNEMVGQILLDDWTLVGWSPNRRYLVTRTRQESETGEFLLQVWRVESSGPSLLGKRRVTQGSADANSNEFFWGGGSITSQLAVVDPSGEWLVYASGLEVAMVPVAEMGTQPAQRLGRHSEPVYGVEMHPDGDRVASIDRAGEIRIWSRSASDARPLRTLSAPKSNYMLLRIDPSGRWLAVTQVEGTVHLWDLDALGTNPLVLRAHSSSLQGVAFTPDGRWIATANRYRPAVWSLTRGYPQKLGGHTSRVDDVVFAPDGGSLASISSDGSVRLWELGVGTRNSDEPLAEGALSSPWEAKFDPLHRFLFVTDHDGAKIFGLTNGSVRRIEPYPDLLSFCIAIGPQGRYLAEGLMDLDTMKRGMIRIHDLATGETWLLKTEDGFGPQELAFQPDGTLLSTGAGGQLLAWDIHARSARVFGERVGVFDLSADGRFLIAAHGGVATLHDLVEGTSRVLESHGTDISAVAIDPSAAFVVTADMGGAIRVGPASGAQPHTLLGHGKRIRALAVDPQGRWIASTAWSHSGNPDDSAVWLWPIPEGEPVEEGSVDEFLDTLRGMTNLRVVRNEESPTGYSVREVAPFGGWKDTPRW